MYPTVDSGLTITCYCYLSTRHKWTNPALTPASYLHRRDRRLSWPIGWLAIYWDDLPVEGGHPPRPHTPPRGLAATWPLSAHFGPLVLYRTRTLMNLYQNLTHEALTVDHARAGGCPSNWSTLDDVVNGINGFPLTTWLTRYSPGVTAIDFISPLTATDEPENSIECKKTLKLN